MAVALTKFNRTTLMWTQGKLGNLHIATIYMQISGTIPTSITAAATREADLPGDHATGGGYTSGGTLVGCSFAAGGTLSTATYILKLTDKVLTATGAAIPAFRYVVLFNNTDTEKHLLGYYDYGSSISLNDGDSFTTDFDATNGVWQLV